MRKAVERLQSGLKIFLQDLRSLWMVAVVLGGYFLIGKRFLYSLCPSVILTGFPCPGCGLTRACFSILKGNFKAAWYLHPFSYVLFLFLIVFGIQRYVIQKEVKCLYKYLIMIIIGMLVFYIYRMVRYFPGEPPMSYYYRSVGYRLWQMAGF